MHAKFNLNPESRNWEKFLDAGNTIHTANKVMVETDLNLFKDADGSLKAGKIIENWFPNIKANIFLSHSHKDEKLVIGLAGWLHEKFGLKSFIDSTVWGYSDQLLHLIDNNYCTNSSTSKKTYNYYKRNRSTSHVHMMLSTALMDMIDRCECVIFVNTPSSYKPAEYFETPGTTESPWIFSEIAMTRMLRQRLPKEHRPKHTYDSVIASQESLQESRDLRVNYPIDLFHLTPLSVNDLDAWEKKESGKKQNASALDSLYKMKEEIL